MSSVYDNTAYIVIRAPHSFPTRRSSDLLLAPVFPHAIMERTLPTASATIREVAVRTGGVRAGQIIFAAEPADGVDRKSTRLNSSHLVISYAVFCLKKKNTKENIHITDIP